MTKTALVTRSTTAAGAGDSRAGVATFERDAKSGVITFGGQNRQLWVLVYEGLEKKDAPTCGAIYTSGEDGGEIVCLRRCTSRAFGIEARSEKLRLVVDLSASGLNDCFVPPRFILPSVEDIVESAYPGCYMLKSDLKDGFYMVALTEAAAQLMGVLNPETNEYMRYERLCMGSGISPAVFCAFLSNISGGNILRLIRRAKFQTRAQIPVVDPRECACPTAIWRIENDLGDDGDGGRSS